MQIQLYRPNQLDAVVNLSLRAWSPVFDSIQAAMNPDIFRELYPNGWRASQQTAVETVCAAEDANVWVAVDGASVAGFVAVKVHLESSLGEIYMIAVEPDYHRRGIGAALTEFALEQIKSAGMRVAMVETGCDTGHAPARCAYEKMGFEPLPIARYFKKL